MKHLLFFAFTAIVVQTYSQGCSDAGFCSLGALKNVPNSSMHKQSIDLGAGVGLGEQNTFSLNPYLQYNLDLNKHFTILGKVTATYASGFLGNSINIGDFYGVATYAPKPGSVNSIRFLAGFKIPFTSSNSKNASGKPLPLDYQSSIGTYDVIGGVNYVIHQKLELDAGVQVPVIQHNKNTFFPDEYNDNRALKFAPTNNFRRKSDVLIRVGYYFPLSKSLSAKPSLLAIYHLGEDTYENRFGKSTSIAGTNGLTLNAGIILTWQFKNSDRFEIVLATPLIVRDVRADGLTRKFVANIQYSIPF